MENKCLISVVLLCILQNFHFIRINNNFYGDLNPKRLDVILQILARRQRAYIVLMSKNNVGWT